MPTIQSTVVEKEKLRELKLSQRDAMMLTDALKKPAKPNVRLQKAGARYNNKTQYYRRMLSK
ncbi:DUF1778 domain-containing protein [Photobacterium sp. OFAV2-7]|uniref:type II toxin -antitoxin system TacA 1-like antitoxin n=1 Tax=Photobacterium sp. OFAV2-7 TaxID=2917748 RepID=UPI001EF74279|nr:DUF1778 domain-containing protein [Photobacterium sp. OFAV2-7]MCG7587622.1 DUF1778 domain-containing protein [Photobacterium sp. OFAV2-7]